jgi:arylsulfate sulfotransferase
MRRQRRERRFAEGFFLSLLLAAWSTRSDAAITGTLLPSPASPAPVGTRITWTAGATGGDLAAVGYRFRVRPAGGTFRIIRDFGPLSTLDWTSLDEGVYEIELAVRPRPGAEVASTIVSTFELRSRVQAGQPVVSPTSHPLVFLFSSPPCTGGNARVQYGSAAGPLRSTRLKACTPGRNLNFYLAGMTPNTSYTANLLVDRGRGSVKGTAIGFTTGDSPLVLPAPFVFSGASTTAGPGVLLYAPLQQRPIATDSNGRLIWSGPTDMSYLTNPGPDGTFYGVIISNIDRLHDAVRQFDLTGITVRETNAARVNEELAAMGKRPINSFHHEARSLGDGRIVVLANVEQILTDVQGPGPVDVIGDMILVLDSDFQVVWAWDTFDHLDPSRRAVLGELCTPGCAAHYLMAQANDWTHGNSVDLTPDGNLLYSIRHQDWLVKIDFRGGAGTGDILWRLGKDGDFAFDSDDPYPWFSHQHDATYVTRNRSTVTLFDNGNTRVGLYPDQSSRGQAIELDEENRIARLVLNADLGVYSGALGSARLQVDGSYDFDAGLVYPADVPNPNPVAFTIHVDPDGEVLSSIQWASPVYRSFQLDDLYGLDAPAVSETKLVGPRF